MALRSHIRSCPAWLALLVPIAALLYGGGVVIYLLTRWPTITIDSAFFQHMGWYVLQGAVPYLDAWDVNPPVPFAITAVLALLSGGDMHVLHGLSVALTTLVAAATVLLVAWVAYLLTGRDAAAVAAGLVMFVIPEFLILPFVGVLAQFYALFFGLAALGLALRDRPFLAGLVAALSAGSWQAGAAFAPLVVGIAYERSGRTGALWAIAGGGIVLGVVVVVFAAAGALVQMVVQTVLAPLIAGPPSSPVERTFSILLAFGYGSLLLPVAIYGWAHALVHHWRERWWVPAGGLILTLQVLFVDMDGATDTFLFLAFVALGVAVTVDYVISWWSVRVDRRDGDVTRSTLRRAGAVAAVVVLAGLLVSSGLVWHHESPPPQATLQTLEDEAEPYEPHMPVTPGDADVPPMRTIYWEKIEPETCHYRLSWNEVRWISWTDDRLDARQCDGWPDRIEPTYLDPAERGGESVPRGLVSTGEAGQVPRGLAPETIDGYIV